MSWCPGPDCQNAVKANYHDALPVTCLCGYTFWFVKIVYFIPYFENHFHKMLI